ncbi:uncharacterized protein LOC111635417 [Centruroides sculpturatus]|uniref:uncharacterized protein LOC111635417 n=1 Tax=Centruroides sculpturatus TaxID=218467 RepID=UPI000C6D28B5|nr:uncharacterized protein LOC111635417 [Centruroides sculpturatus]
MPFRTETCCCFKDTKRGSYCCGIYTLTASVIIIVGSAVYLAMEPFKSHEYYLVEGEAVYDVMRISSIIHLSMAILLFLISLLLLVGVKKDNRFLLIPWMVWIIFVLVMHVIYVIFAIIAAIRNPMQLIQAFFFLLSFCLNLYCFRCVYSQYKLLQEEEESRARFHKIKNISGPL